MSNGFLPQNERPYVADHYRYKYVDWVDYPDTEEMPFPVNAEEDRGRENDYGTCYFCGEWKPTGMCPRGH